MSVQFNTSLANGYLQIGDCCVYKAVNETVIKFFTLTNKDASLQTFELWFNFADGTKAPLVPQISFYSGWTLQLVDSEQEISMAAGDFISGFASIADKISFLLTGYQVEYDIFDK